MASTEAKARRRAEALNELHRLSGLLADNLNVEMPDVAITNRDPQFAEIQRVEAINGLLAKILSASGVKTEPQPEKIEEKAPGAKAATKKAVKKTSKK